MSTTRIKTITKHVHVFCLDYFPTKIKTRNVFNYDHCPSFDDHYLQYMVGAFVELSLAHPLGGYHDKR